MTAMLWRQLCKRYGINIKFFSAYYLETDSQTESTNKVIKNYLHAYIAYTQNDWVDHLPMAKFATSNHVNALTGVTPFFVNYSFHSCIGIESPGTYKGEGE